jgi:hypothetical protein
MRKLDDGLARLAGCESRTRRGQQRHGRQSGGKLLHGVLPELLDWMSCASSSARHKGTPLLAANQHFREVMVDAIFILPCQHVTERHANISGNLCEIPHTCWRKRCGIPHA